MSSLIFMFATLLVISILSPNIQAAEKKQKKGNIAASSSKNSKKNEIQKKVKKDPLNVLKKNKKENKISKNHKNTKKNTPVKIAINQKKQTTSNKGRSIASIKDKKKLNNNKRKPNSAEEKLIKKSHWKSKKNIHPSKKVGLKENKNTKLQPLLSYLNTTEETLGEGEINDVYDHVDFSEADNQAFLETQDKGTTTVRADRAQLHLED